MAKVYYYNVKNRSAGIVLYKIPEQGITRRFAPGETKRLSYEELLQLSYLNFLELLRFEFVRN